jgi:hypothetical protein
LHDPREFISSRHTLVRVWILLRLICQEQLRRSSICETPTREFNHTSVIWLRSFSFLLVFFDSQARISLRGEVNRVVTRLIIRGVVVLRLQGSDLCGLKQDRCVALRQIVVYPHLTEDREPTSPSSGIQRQIYRQVYIYPLLRVFSVFRPIVHRHIYFLSYNHPRRSLCIFQFQSS